MGGELSAGSASSLMCVQQREKKQSRLDKTRLDRLVGKCVCVSSLSVLGKKCLATTRTKTWESQHVEKIENLGNCYTAGAVSRNT